MSDFEKDYIFGFVRLLSFQWCITLYHCIAKFITISPNRVCQKILKFNKNHFVITFLFYVRFLKWLHIWIFHDFIFRTMYNTCIFIYYLKIGCCRYDRGHWCVHDRRVHLTGVTVWWYENWFHLTRVTVW